LYAFHPETSETLILNTPSLEGETEETLSTEEKLRRERTRSRGLGVTDYAWLPRSHRMIIPLNGNIYILDDIIETPKMLVSRGEHPLLDPQPSPDGGLIAFVCDSEIYVVDVMTGDQRQLTKGARGCGKVHGLAEYIAQEEMGRQRGYWWSPDSQFIAFTEVDERHIPIYPIVHQGKDVTGEDAQEEHRYPFAGMPNAKVRLNVIPVCGGEPVWINLDYDMDTYLAQVLWKKDGTLAVVVENRAQTELHLLQCDPAVGSCHLLIREINPVWINLHSMYKPLNDGRFIWASERTGYMHLYLYNQHGELIRPLTSGAWIVDNIAGVDERRNLVYFLSTKDSPLERHLYVVTLAGKHIRRVTSSPGFHEVHLDHKKIRFLNTFSTPTQPPTITLNTLEDGHVLKSIYVPNEDESILENLQVPEIIEVNADGVILYGMIYRPPASYGSGPYPTIVSVYGGPHVQQVTKSWSTTSDMRSQFLCNAGFLVIKLDNRGSARRGQAFEGALKHNMGDIEVQDQVAGVQWLVEQGLADPSRVGVYGWSYGGYMALMCLARAPQVFHAAVAGAPVTHWDGYDTHYTERYMSTPQENPRGYHRSSVLAHADGILGKILLIHGLVDENVHFRHTARLINALIHADKLYDLLLFPDERHMPRRQVDRKYLETRIRDFFLENL
jgi:dipeptidyl-peptidase-4